MDSHCRKKRTSGSCARRNDKAVEPVRGRLSPKSGATIGTSSIPGHLRYQSSIWSRFTRCPTRPRIDNGFAGLVQPCLVAERTHQNLEALAKRVLPKIVESGLRCRRSDQIVVNSHSIPPPFGQHDCRNYEPFLLRIFQPNCT